jgi:RND family efflux transporter MFP subunit
MKMRNPGLIWAPAPALALALGLLAAPLEAQQSAATQQKAIEPVSGVVVAARSWDVTPRDNTQITRLYFTEGQEVKEGDLLVELDSGYKQLEVDLARAERDRAGVMLEDYRDTMQRQEKLKTRGAVSVKSYRDAYYAVETAEADLAIANVKLEMAKAVLAAQKIYAPFDGRITASNFRENAYVNRTREIATVVQLDPINVRATISAERLVSRLIAEEFGAGFGKTVRVELKLSDGAVYEYPGRIISAGIGVDTNTGQGTLTISFPNPDGILRPGLSVLLTGYVAGYVE